MTSSSLGYGSQSIDLNGSLSVERVQIANFMVFLRDVKSEFVCFFLDFLNQIFIIKKRLVALLLKKVINFCVFLGYI